MEKNKQIECERCSKLEQYQLSRNHNKVVKLSKTIIDLSNMRFGKWSVGVRDDTKTGKGIYWICKCDCGEESSVRGTSLRNGHTTKCLKCQRWDHKLWWNK